MLVRTVRCLEGEVEIELVCEPAFDYGRTPAEWTLVDGSRHMADATGAGQTIRLHTDLELGIEVNRVRARHTLRAGREVFAALSWEDDLRGPADVDEATARLDATVRFWRRWLGRARPFADHRWREAIQRSALTIKGLTYMPTGATVAALTTSLPETPGGERNWDYRYTWMRDTHVHAAGAAPAAGSTGRPTSSCSSSPTSSPTRTAGCRSCTGSTAGATSPSRSARSCPGTPAPARCGSATAPSTSARTTSTGRCSTRSSSTPSTASGCRGGCGRSWRPRPKCATERWREPDQGIWEARGKPQHYVSSKLMSWVAMDRAAKLAEIRGDRDLAKAVGGDRRGDPRRHPRARAHASDGVLRQHYDTDALDASTLLAAMFGFLPGDDERLHAVVMAIADELTENGYVLRYRTDETDDGLSGKEGTFLICSFWLVSALSIVGEAQRAHDLMERLLRIASPLGLYAEEFDADTGRHLGNFPQAFSHLALIEAAARIILAEQLALEGLGPPSSSALARSIPKAP